jgi:hypothetical protein
MIEWLDVAPGIRVIATPAGATRSRSHGFGHDPFATPMQGPGSPETTHWLLEAAIALAAEQQRPPRSSPGEARLAPSVWAYRLCGYFHTTHATRRLLPAVARRFKASGRTLLASWAEQKVGEELGHDQLALMDLAELGYAGEELTKSVAPARAAAWVAQFEALAMESDPVGCVGYAHALERLSLLRGPAELRAIEAALPAGVNATRCLRVHSAVGSDAAHVHDNVRVTAALSANERRQVVIACHRTAQIYFDPSLGRAPNSAQLEGMLAPFRLARGRSEKPSIREECARG